MLTNGESYWISIIGHAVKYECKYSNALGLQLNVTIATINRVYSISSKLIGD